jgi:hypothetical protein
MAINSHNTGENSIKIHTKSNTEFIEVIVKDAGITLDRIGLDYIDNGVLLTPSNSCLDGWTPQRSPN